MYRLNDKQFDFILEDVRSRGIELEGLRNDLGDHICCIFEEQMTDEKDFFSEYETIIRTFYNNHLGKSKKKHCLLPLIKTTIP
jgi:hypothetical protein